jgi:hypothetical protein
VLPVPRVEVVVVSTWLVWLVAALVSVVFLHFSWIQQFLLGWSAGFDALSCSNSIVYLAWLSSSCELPGSVAFTSICKNTHLGVAIVQQLIGVLAVSVVLCFPGSVTLPFSEDSATCDWELH